MSDYRVFEEDDAFPGKPGYEYRIMTIDYTRLTESDGSGTTHSIFREDYYNSKLHHASYRKDESEMMVYTVLWNGELMDYTLWSRIESITGGIRSIWTAQVPKGYDGVIVGYMNNALPYSSKAPIDDYYTSAEDFAMFRMK